MKKVDNYKTHGFYFKNLNLRVAGATLLFALTVGIPELAYAQEPTEPPIAINKASQSKPVKPRVINEDVRDMPTVELWKPGDPVREVPRKDPRSSKEVKSNKIMLPQVIEPQLDPLLERQKRILPKDVIRAISTPDVNVEGISFTGAFPPDTVGDVGPNHYIQMVNDGAGGSIFAIYDKAGNLLAGPTSLQSLNTNPPQDQCASGSGDPIVLYDPLADRWLMSEFSALSNVLCVYISQTADPVSGGWFIYEFPTPEFPDYPKYGVWPDAYYVSSNESSPAAYALDRNQMLQGLPATFQRFTAPRLIGFGFQALVPSDLDGPTPPPGSSPNFFMRHRDDEVHGTFSPPNLFDLQDIPLSFQPDGVGGFDVESVTPPFDGNLGSNLGLSDDDSSEQSLGFTFPFQGANYTSVFVNSNGNLTFGVGDFDFSESVDEFINGPPRIAPFWDDLNPDSGGGVFFKTLTSPNRAVITWSNLPEFFDTGSTGSNTAQVVLFESGGITIRYNGVDLTDAIVGIGPGGAGGNLNQLNFSEDLPQSSLKDHILELFAMNAPGPADPTQDALEIWEFKVDFANAENSRFTGPILVPIAEFNSDLCGLFSFFCFPQPGTDTMLDPLREVIMWRLQYRNFGTHETLVGNFVTDVDGTDRGGIRWFELRKTGSGPWTLFQEGTHSPDQANRWMGSISMDKDGNIALGYSVSNGSLFPSIRYAGRLQSDPTGTLPQNEVTIIDGQFSQIGSVRWGDYSSMNVDPVDDCTFWYTNEYVGTDDPTDFGMGAWRTRIASFRFPSCEAPIQPIACDPDTPGAIIGTPDNDVLLGTKGDDVIISLGGDDRIIGRGGNDCIDSGPGNDVILTGDGRDTIIAGDGNDKVSSGAGNDTVNGGAGNDRIISGQGADQILAGEGSDAVFAGRGNDIVNGGGGNDRINGAGGDDTIDGGPGTDTVNGGSGTNTCINVETSFNCNE